VVWVGDEPPPELRSEEELRVSTLTSPDDVVDFLEENRSCVVVVSQERSEEASRLFGLVNEEAPKVPCVLAA